jgi:cell division septum initiation protein DivIVA
MTVFNPNTASEADGAAAQFPVVLRGYDRQLVDAHVGELAEQLEQERQRSNHAELALRQLQVDLKEGRGQLPAWFADLGAEVTQVVQEAGLAAGNLLAEAGTRVQAVIDAAQAQAAERLKAAEQQASALEQAVRQRLADAQATQAQIQAEATAAAEQLLARAERDAQAVLARAQEQAHAAWQQAAEERRRLEAESGRLGTLRQEMVDQLVQVYAPLGLTLVDTRSLPAPGNGGGPTAQGAAPALPTTASDTEPAG